MHFPGSSSYYKGHIYIHIYFFSELYVTVNEGSKINSFEASDYFSLFKDEDLQATADSTENQKGRELSQSNTGTGDSVQGSLPMCEMCPVQDPVRPRSK